MELEPKIILKNKLPETDVPAWLLDEVRMVGGPEAAVRGKEAHWIPDAITAVTRIGSSCKLLYRCSIDERECNGRMCGMMLRHVTHRHGDYRDTCYLLLDLLTVFGRSHFLP